jgi:glycosyltransferase involved in cell wall biosynthesis
MKVNWFSPLPPSRTGIAEYSLHALAALAQRAQVIVWTDQTEWDARVERFARVRQFAEQPAWDEMNKADATFYNIGNNLDFHARIWQISRRHAGIVVLHDTHLQHLFAGAYRHLWNDAEGYRAVMTRHYGEAGREAVKSYERGVIETHELSARFPLTALALENALAAVVHVSSEVESLAQASRRPVIYAPLPYAANPGPHVAAPSATARGADDPPYRIVVFGYLGPNRRLDAILRALERLQRRDQLRLEVYGKLSKPHRWRQSIRRAGLADVVTLHGPVSESVLDNALASAHLAINLRYPAMGEASWTQLKLWSHGLPSLVTQTGWYATLPASAVAHVRPTHEIADIRRHLTEFLDDPAAFAAMGRESLRILREKHAPRAYADILLDAARQAERFRGRVSAFQLVERTGEILSQWASNEDQTPSLQRIAEGIRRVAA